MAAKTADNGAAKKVAKSPKTEKLDPRPLRMRESVGKKVLGSSEPEEETDDEEDDESESEDDEPEVEEVTPALLVSAIGTIPGNKAPESTLKRLLQIPDLKDIVLNAIKTTPGIEAVAYGPIEARRVHLRGPEMSAQELEAEVQRLKAIRTSLQRRPVLKQALHAEPRGGQATTSPYVQATASPYVRAPVSEERLKQENEAAAKIQAMQRGRQARNRVDQIRQDRKQIAAAQKIQAMERGRKARLRAEQMRRDKEQEILRDIALMANPNEMSEISARKALGQAKGWNRAGGGPDGTLGDRDSFSTPYGTGLDWGTIGYRIPTASPSPMKTGLKVKEKRVPGKPLADRTALAAFKVDMLRREQSLSAAWRTFLDPDWQGKLAIHEFCNACRNMGWKGNVRAIWKDMDVDGNGLVSLAELDWEEAHELGEFHRKLVRVYGSAEEAAKKWGMQAPRRFKIDEFYDTVISGGFVDGAIAADRLFRMLCDVPVEGECCGHLGVLKDEATSVTEREMKWLDAIGPGLPHVTRDRVQPGDLGYVHEDLEKATLLKIKHSHDVDKFFEHMYNDAVEHHKRRNELMEPEKTEDKVITDPYLFERLHKDHGEKMERRAKLKKAIDDHAWHEANWRVGKTRDAKAIKRILEPKRQFCEFNFDCVAKKEHLWHLLTIDQLMGECDKLVPEIKKEQPYFDWKSMGKTKNELVEMLYRYTPEASREINPNAKVPEAIEKLHHDGEGRKERLEHKQREAIQREDEEFKSTLICPHHGAGLSHPTCGTCRRFLAIKTGEEKDCDHEVMFEKTDDHVKKKREHQESLFKQLLEEGYHKGLVANRDYVSCKVALEDAYAKDDRRWYYCVGRDRRRLIEEAIKYYSARVEKDDQRKKEIIEKHFETHGSAFYRLHVSGIQFRAKSEDQRRREEDAAQATLDLMNVHRHAKERGGSLFQTLHDNPEVDVRSDVSEVDHGDYPLTRRRARDRSVERQKLLARREAALETIKASASGRRVLDYESKEKAPFEKVLGLYFEDIYDARKLPSKFEVALRVRLEEIGVPDAADMPCRYRPVDGGGLIIEMKGRADQTAAALAVPKAEDIVSCKQICTNVWEFDLQPDICGEFYDCLMFNYDTLEDSWNNHFGLGGTELTKDRFVLKARQMGFAGNAVEVWHALVYDTGGPFIDEARFMKHVKEFRNPAKMHAWAEPPSDNMVSFSEALRRAFPSAREAFEAFNTSGSGKLNPTEFMKALNAMKKERRVIWDGNFLELWKELDVRNKGELRWQEFQRLGVREVTDRMRASFCSTQSDDTPPPGQTSDRQSGQRPKVVKRNRGQSIRGTERIELGPNIDSTQRRRSNSREARRSVTPPALDRTLRLGDSKSSDGVKDHRPRSSVRPASPRGAHREEHQREPPQEKAQGVRGADGQWRKPKEKDVKGNIATSKMDEPGKEARSSLRPASPRSHKSKEKDRPPSPRSDNLFRSAYESKEKDARRTPKKRMDEGGEPESEPEKSTRSPVMRKSLNLSGSLRERASAHNLLSAGSNSARARASRLAPVKYQAR